MRITIDFERPYFDESTISGLELRDLDNFYANENAVNRLNLFFVLEASLHRFRKGNHAKAAARCAFFMAYYLFLPLTPPASLELAEYYIDKALEWDETPEYRRLKSAIGEGN